MAGKARLRIPLLEEIAIQGQKTFADPGRSLNPEERRLLLIIFGQSVNLSRVQIVLTDLGAKGRPYTLGNTIRIPRGTQFDAQTLVHEMTHVWQYQTRGTNYISDSVVHQLTSGQGAYDVTLVPGQSIYEYTAEQEAVIVERYYADDPPGWSQNPHVVRMIDEVRRARPLSSDDIRKETWFGPGKSPLDNIGPANDANRQTPTVPLIRIEF
jgi:hypothetical protein